MSNKKIGILTQYYRRNYGGILQSYALFKTVQSMGYDVEILDFRYDAKKNLSIGQMACMLKGKMINIFRTKKSGKSDSVGPLKRKLPTEHIEAFARFKNKYLKYSPELYNNTIGQYSSQYDAIIVGSDQVWNDVEGKHLFYFFDFGVQYKGLKIAYAPCSIITKTSQSTKRRLKKRIEAFDAVSVRDKTTRNLVCSMTNLEPEIVLDPTILYGFDEFTSKPIVEGDYVFTYILGSGIECGHYAVLNKIFEKYGKMKVVAAIIPDDSLEVEKYADEIKYNAAPDEWVNLIANSKFVYTDSFHGCVFAMKFHKPFYAYYKDARRASRLIDLSSTYSIDNIKSSRDNVVLSEIDYLKVDFIIERQKEKSMDFLKNNLP